MDWCRASVQCIGSGYAWYLNLSLQILFHYTFVRWASPRLSQNMETCIIYITYIHNSSTLQFNVTGIHSSTRVNYHGTSFKKCIQLTIFQFACTASWPVLKRVLSRFSVMGLHTYKTILHLDHTHPVAAFQIRTGTPRFLSSENCGTACSILFVSCNYWTISSLKSYNKNYVWEIMCSQKSAASTSPRIQQSVSGGRTRSLQLGVLQFVSEEHHNPYS